MITKLPKDTELKGKLNYSVIIVDERDRQLDLDAYNMSQKEAETWADHRNRLIGPIEWSIYNSRNIKYKAVQTNSIKTVF